MLKRLLVAAAIMLSALSAPAVLGSRHHVAGGHYPPTEQTVTLSSGA